MYLRCVSGQIVEPQPRLIICRPQGFGDQHRKHRQLHRPGSPARPPGNRPTRGRGPSGAGPRLPLEPCSCRAGGSPRRLQRQLRRANERGCRASVKSAPGPPGCRPGGVRNSLARSSPLAAAARPVCRPAASSGRHGTWAGRTPCSAEPRFGRSVRSWRMLEVVRHHQGVRESRQG
jgi:hypothetical protein